jgi:hypothetical protein
LAAALLVDIVVVLAVTIIIVNTETFIVLLLKRIPSPEIICRAPVKLRVRHTTIP